MRRDEVQTLGRVIEHLVTLCPGKPVRRLRIRKYMLAQETGQLEDLKWLVVGPLVALLS